MQILPAENRPSTKKVVTETADSERENLPPSATKRGYLCSFGKYGYIVADYIGKCNSFREIS